MQPATTSKPTEMPKGARISSRDRYAHNATTAIAATIATSVGELLPGPEGWSHGREATASADIATATRCTDPGLIRSKAGRDHGHVTAPSASGVVLKPLRPAYRDDHFGQDKDAPARE